MYNAMHSTALYITVAHSGVALPSLYAVYRHCTMCRTWGGAPFLGVECGSQLEFDGPITTYDSSDWAERGFCSNCGTHLFYRLKDSNKYVMPAGLFDGQADLIFDHQIFIDEKPIYYSFSNATQTMTGAEVFAAYAPKE